MIVCAGHFAEGHFRAGAKQDMLSIYTRGISFNTEDVVNSGPMVGEAGYSPANCGVPDSSMAATWKEGGEEEIVRSRRAADLVPYSRGVRRRPLAESQGVVKNTA